MRPVIKRLVPIEDWVSLYSISGTVAELEYCNGMASWGARMQQAPLISDTTVPAKGVGGEGGLKAKLRDSGA